MEQQSRSFRQISSHWVGQQDWAKNRNKLCLQPSYDDDDDDGDDDDDDDYAVAEVNIKGGQRVNICWTSWPEVLESGLRSAFSDVTACDVANCLQSFSDYIVWTDISVR